MTFLATPLLQVVRPCACRRIMEERKKQADEQRAAMKIRQYMQKACTQFEM